MSTSHITNGDSIYYTLPDVVNQMVGGSFMHWIAPHHLQGVNQDERYIVQLYEDASNYIAMFFDNAANTVTMRYRVGAINYEVTFTPDAWTWDDWHSVGGSWQAPNGYLKAYWDGVLVGTPILLSSAISATSATLYMGYNDATKQFIGRRDRFDLFDRQLPTSEFVRFHTERFL